MPARFRPPDERSAGGVVVRRRPPPDGPLEVVLIRVGAIWGVPKGNLDPGEASEATAVREIEEEVGLPRELLRVLAPLPPSEYAYRRHDTGRLVFKRVDHFLVALEGHDRPLVPQLAEVDEAQWVDLDAAGALISHRDLRAVIAAAARWLAAHPGAV